MKMNSDDNNLWPIPQGIISLLLDYNDENFTFTGKK